MVVVTSVIRVIDKRLQGVTRNMKSEESRFFNPLETFHHGLTSPLTTVFTLCGIEGVTHGDVEPLETIGRTLTAEHIGLQQRVIRGSREIRLKNTIN